MRDEHLRDALAFQALAAHITNDAHNGQPRRGGLRGATLESLSQRLFVRPEPARHRFVDDGDRRGVLIVLRIEETPLARMHTQRLKERAAAALTTQRNSPLVLTLRPVPCPPNRRIQPY